MNPSRSDKGVLLQTANTEMDMMGSHDRATYMTLYLPYIPTQFKQIAIISQQVK